MIHHQFCSTRSKTLTRLSAILLLAVCSLTAGTVKGDLVNGDFELPDFGNVTNFHLLAQNDVPGWLTTASDGKIELWSNGYSGAGTPGFPIYAHSGKNHAELNATEVGTLFQDVADIAGSQEVDFEFSHRGRGGIDTMRLQITDLGSDNLFGTGDDTILFSKEYSAGNGAWVVNNSALEAPIITLGNSMRFSYESVSAHGGDTKIGNFIDNAKFGLNALAIPEPSSAAILGLAALGICIRRRRR